MERPTVFISYSWDSDEHQEWVLKLANDLMSKFGIQVLLDQYELLTGKELTYFMETSIEKSSKVLIIMSPNYKIKAENRTGGVGFEYSLISQELFEIQAGNNKFMPILRNGDINTSCPKYIKSKICHQMTDNSKYLSQLYELSRIIYDKPKLLKPTLGPIPDFDDPDYDPILELANNLSNSEHLNKALNQILDSEEGLSLANSEIERLFNSIKTKANLYTEKSKFKFLIKPVSETNLILSCDRHNVVFNWMQALSNTLDNSKLTVSFWNGYLPNNNENRLYFPGSKPQRIKTVDYKFDFNLKRESIWSLMDKSNTTSEGIIKMSFSHIIDQIRKEKEKGFRIN